MPRKEEATPFLKIGEKEFQTLGPRTFFRDPKKMSVRKTWLVNFTCIPFLSCFA